MPSAILHPEVIDKYLRDELDCERLVEVPRLMQFMFRGSGPYPRSVSQENGV